MLGRGLPQPSTRVAEAWGHFKAVDIGGSRDWRGLFLGDAKGTEKGRNNEEAALRETLVLYFSELFIF